MKSRFLQCIMLYSKVKTRKLKLDERFSEDFAMDDHHSLFIVYIKHRRLGVKFLQTVIITFSFALNGIYDFQ